MNYDVFLVGLGGQGILTIGEILAGVAQHEQIPANFYPSKGMAQRGGFVKAQLRLGREGVGPNIPQRSADLVVAMELSEALKAVRFVKEGGYFILFSETWSPTAVMLGKAKYPTHEQVEEQIAATNAHLVVIDPTHLPVYHGEPVAPNIFMLGVAMKSTSLGKFFKPEIVNQVIQERWKRAAEANQFAFEAGMNFQVKSSVRG
jgi:indolepyruvate ferredoxin oxidoreductase, beta subunit